jgi:DNA-binding response OmpR family regulator
MTKNPRIGIIVMALILVIDDQELVRASIRITLEAAGHEVDEAEDGEVGVKLQEERLFDVVITDILMPVKEGIETIVDLRRNYEDLKIIAISGGSRSKTMDYLKAATSLGADKVLSKPFSNEELLSCVNECLGG